MAYPQLYIGLISGTSMDGIDAVLVDFSSTAPVLLTHHCHPIPDKLASQLHALCRPGDNEINHQGDADVQVARLLADAVVRLLADSGYSKKQILAIGSHGQTIRHMPDLNHPFTMQIGDGNTLAALTGIDVVADFRRKDMALGGQGAPLVPAFHQAVFSSKDTSRVILNVGGISNLTYLPSSTESDQAVIGYDCGPGNTLLDQWCYRHMGKRYDKNGEWAASGHIHQPLLSKMLSEPYFRQPAPKSTGRELFNLNWLDTQLSEYGHVPAEDVQATLLALTAQSVAQAVVEICPSGELYVCGGGAHNQALMQAFQGVLPSHRVTTTNELGVDVDWVEAITFAWLAKRFNDRQPGNLPSVTGASRTAILGALYPAD